MFCFACFHVINFACFHVVCDKSVARVSQKNVLYLYSCLYRNIASASNKHREDLSPNRNRRAIPPRWRRAERETDQTVPVAAPRQSVPTRRAAKCLIPSIYRASPRCRFSLAPRVRRRKVLKNSTPLCLSGSEFLLNSNQLGLFSSPIRYDFTQVL